MDLGRSMAPWPACEPEGRNGVSIHVEGPRQGARDLRVGECQKRAERPESGREARRRT